jgi:hypothetical protein
MQNATFTVSIFMKQLLEGTDQRPSIPNLTQSDQET